MSDPVEVLPLEKEQPEETDKKLDGEEKPRTMPEDEGAEEPSKFITIDLPQIDKLGNEIIARVTVPVIKETKERKFKVIKRKRTVPKKIPKDHKVIDKDLEEEYDACILVETLTQTVQIRTVQENGKVEIKEQDYVQEFFIGKERKFKYVRIEKTKKDGTIEMEEELEVEEEIEEKQPKKLRKKQKVCKQMYDPDTDYIGEEYEWEGDRAGEEEGRVKEEFSHIEEEEEFGSLGREKKYLKEKTKLDDEEWKVMEELEEEEKEEEEMETIEIKEKTLWEKELKRQKECFNKLMKIFLMEIQRRKSLMKNLKALTKTKKEYPSKEFAKNSESFIDEEAAEVYSLMKHLVKVYYEYKEEEALNKKKLEEADIEKKKDLKESKEWQLNMINACKQNIFNKLAKRKDLSKLVDETFKFEKLLSKEHIKKTTPKLNIEQIKNRLFMEVGQSLLPDKDKKVVLFELYKMLKALKIFEAQGVGDHAKYVKEKNKFFKNLENFVCKRREADYARERSEKFIKKNL